MAGEKLKVAGITLKLDGAATFQGDLDKTAAKLRANTAELKKVQSQHQGNEKSIGALTEKQKALSSGLELQKSKTQQLKDVLAETVKQLKENGDEQAENSIQAERLRAAIAESEAYEAQFEARLKETNEQIAEQSNKLKLAGASMLETGEKVKGFSEKISNVGKTLSVGVTTPLLAIGTAAGKMYLDYEKSAAKVSTVMDTTVMSAKSMSDAIMEAATEVGYSATDYAEATYQAISASVDTADAVDFVKEATKLAEGGFTDLTTAIDIETTALNAYGLEASEATRVSDVLIQTQNKGKTTVDQLASNMGKVIPTAAAYNVSIENLGTSLAILTAGGISTEQSCTYLKSMLNELAKTGSTVSDTLKKQTGKTFSELMESGYSLGDVLAVLGVDVSGLKTKIKSLTDSGMEFDEALSKLTEQGDANATAFANLWSSQEAGTAALALLNAGTEKYNETLTDMNGAAGSTQSAFETMQTDGVKLEKSIQTLKNELTAFGEELTPAVEMATDAISKLASWFGNLSEKGKKTVITIAGVAAAAGPVLTVGGKVVKLGGSVIKGTGKLVTWLGKLKKTTAEASSGASMLTSKIGKTVTTMGSATSSTTAFSGAATLATASTATLAAGLTVLVAVGAAVTVASKEAKKHQEEWNKTIDEFSGKMGEFSSQVESANGYLSDYNGSLVMSSDTISEIDQGIDSAQQKILKIGERAAAESRSITSREYEEISNLIGMIDTYAGKKLDAYKTQQEVVKARASRETEMTGEKASNYMHDAKETYEQAVAMAELAKNSAYSAAQEFKDDTQKYNAALSEADKNYKENIEEANALYGDTVGTITSAYTNQSSELKNVIELLNATKTYTDANGVVHVTQDVEKMRSAFEGANGSVLSAWLEMVATTEANGGKVSDSVKLIEGQINDTFDKLPNNTKETFKNLMQGALNGLKEKEPELYKKASNIANGVISRFNVTFEVKSPSRAMRRLFRYVGQGGVLGLEDEESNFYKVADRIAGGVTDKFNSKARLKLAKAVSGDWANPVLSESKAALTSLISNDWSKYANFGSIAAAQARAVEAMRQYSYNSSYHYSNDDNRQYYTTESGIHIGSLVVSGTDGQSLDRQLELIEEKRAAAARARGIR